MCKVWNSLTEKKDTSERYGRNYIFRKIAGKFYK